MPCGELLHSLVGFRDFGQTGRSKSFECVVLRQPFFPLPPQLTQIITQFQNDNFQLVFAVRSMAKMVFPYESSEVIFLKRSPLPLIAGWVGMAGVARQVELIG